MLTLPWCPRNHSGAQVLARPASGTVWLRTNVQLTRSVQRAKPIVLPVQLVV